VLDALIDKHTGGFNAQAANSPRNASDSAAAVGGGVGNASLLFALLGMLLRFVHSCSTAVRAVHAMPDSSASHVALAQQLAALQTLAFGTFGRAAALAPLSPLLTWLATRVAAPDAVASVGVADEKDAASGELPREEALLRLCLHTLRTQVETRATPAVLLAPIAAPRATTAAAGKRPATSAPSTTLSAQLVVLLASCTHASALVRKAVILSLVSLATVLPLGAARDALFASLPPVLAKLVSIYQERQQQQQQSGTAVVEQQ
jgi:hypothetical protein